MKTITKYVSRDGVEFTEEAPCRAYEAEATEIQQIMGRLRAPPDLPGCGFANGDGFIQHDRDVWLSVQRSLARIVQRHFGDDSTYKRHIDWTLTAQEPAGHTFIGRLISDGMPGKAMWAVWSRIMCVDTRFREWGQPYYASHPDEAKQVDLTMRCAPVGGVAPDARP